MVQECDNEGKKTLDWTDEFGILEDTLLQNNKIIQKFFSLQFGTISQILLRGIYILIKIMEFEIWYEKVKRTDKHY